MARTIDAKLVEFKTKVGGNIGSMQTSVSSLSSKLGSLSSLCSNTSSSISNSYKSINQSNVLSKFSQIQDIYSKLSNSLEGDMGAILSRASVLVENVTKLESLLKEIEEAEAKIANAGSYKSESSASSSAERKEIREHNANIKRIIDEAQAVINSKGAEFDSLHVSSLSELTALQGMDSSISFVGDFPVANIKSVAEYYVGKDFLHKKYEASNGVLVDYFLYVPKYSTDVTGLPVHLYLHSAGAFHSDATTKESLPMLLKNGTVKANGIVICPQGTANMSHWRDEKYEAALIELTNNIVAEYNADSNRISLSGHSRGAQDGYKYVADNPGYFSAFIPVSGHSGAVKKDNVEGWESLGNVKIWAFHGDNDDTVEYAGAVVAKRTLNEKGYNNMELYRFRDGNHYIQDDVYKKTYEYSDGVSYNPLEWAFSQTNV